MELLYLAVGGAIGILGSAVATFLSHRFSARESQRHDLVHAYVKWSVALSRAVEEWKTLESYDHVARLKANHEEELRDVEPSAAGRTREEIVRSKLVALGELEAACSQLLLIEGIAAFSNRAIRISHFEHGTRIGIEILEIMAYAERKMTESRELLSDVRTRHPLLRRP